MKAVLAKIRMQFRFDGLADRNRTRDRSDTLILSRRHLKKIETIRICRSRWRARLPAM